MIKELKSFATMFITTESSPLIESFSTSKTYFTTIDTIKKITGMSSPEPYLAILDLPNESDLPPDGPIIVFDKLQDPGNLGTLIRSALALGFKGALFLPDTVDPFNDKALRASKGAIFHMPYKKGTLKDLENYHLYIGDTTAESIEKTEVKKPFGLILSNEGNGYSKDCFDKAKGVSIPINTVESLNVAVAGSLLMYGMKNYV